MQTNHYCTLLRFLNNAEIAPYVSGANYTFFVPIDDAFERFGLDKLSDEDMSSDIGVKLLLHHFVKGRLYDRDLKHDEVFETIGGGAVKIQRLLPGKLIIPQNLLFADLANSITILLRSLQAMSP